MPVARAAAALAVALVVVACASIAEKASPLAGTWSSIDGEGREQVITFRDDGSAAWRLGRWGATFEIRYRIDEREVPPHLDLYGFEQGPYQNMTLYGIYDLLERDSFRYESRPGPSGMSGLGFRPERFARGRTVTFTRVP
jgi:hypothetical protein